MDGSGMATGQIDSTTMGSRSSMRRRNLAMSRRSDMAFVVRVEGDLRCVNAIPVYVDHGRSKDYPFIFKQRRY